MASVTIERDFSLSIGSKDFAESPDGISCTFLTIGTTGLKLYRTQQARDLSYGNQLRLSECGIAPTVGMKTKVTVKDEVEDCTYYAFETEIVDCADRKHYNKLRDGDDYQSSQDYIGPYRDAVCKLRAAIDDCPEDIYWFDDHVFNVGITGAGRAVLIDCADDLFGGGAIAPSFK